MKSNNTLTIIRRIGQLLTVLVISACSGEADGLLADVNEEATENATTEVKTGRLRIGLDEATTRLTYSGKSTAFEDGELIGCVITAGDTKKTAKYYCTAAWKYNSDGLLTISKWWIPNNNIWELHTATQDSTTDFLTYDSTNYTGINTDEYLYFYFYYPFIDPTTNGDDIPSTATDGSTTYLMGMPVGEDYADQTIQSYSSVTSTTTTTTTSTTALTTYNWEKFPIFINTDQSSASKLNMSDFLYDAYEAGVNNEAVGTLSLSFRKETATILVNSGLELTDVKISSTDEDTPIVIGQYVDLYADEEVSGSTPDNYTLSTDAYITSYDYSSGSYQYRFILPRQSSWAGTLTYTESGTTSTASLEDFGSSLSKGTLYTVELASTNDRTCSFEYVSGSSGNLVTSYTSTFSYGYDSSTNKTPGWGTTSTVTIEGSSYTDYLKLEAGPKTYVQIVVPLNMYLKIYSVYQSSTHKITITNTSDSSTTTGTFSSASDNSYDYYYCSISAGTYQITRSSGTTNLLLIVLTYTDPGV